MELIHIRLRTGRFAGLTQNIHRGLFGLFLIQFALVWAKLWLPFPFFGAARWPDGLLLVLAAATTVAALTRQLPGQNVMVVSILIAFIAGAAASLGALTGVPFGPYTYTPHLGRQLFYPLPWAVPILWMVAILNSRGVARLILRPWRQNRNYGFWLIGLAAFLVVLLDLALEPFATTVKGFWSWQATKIPLDWYGAPCVNFLGWAVTTLIILAFATPWLINKMPVKHPPDYHPLILWLLFNLLSLTGAVAHHLWAAVAVILAQSVGVAVLAVRKEIRNPKSEGRKKAEGRIPNSEGQSNRPGI